MLREFALAVPERSALEEVPARKVFALAPRSPVLEREALAQAHELQVLVLREPERVALELRALGQPEFAELAFGGQAFERRPVA